MYGCRGGSRVVSEMCSFPVDFAAKADIKCGRDLLQQSIQSSDMVDMGCCHIYQRTGMQCCIKWTVVKTKITLYPSDLGSSPLKSMAWDRIGWCRGQDCLFRILPQDMTSSGFCVLPSILRHSSGGIIIRPLVCVRFKPCQIVFDMNLFSILMAVIECGTQTLLQFFQADVGGFQDPVLT